MLLLIKSSTRWATSINDLIIQMKLRLRRLKQLLCLAGLSIVIVVISCVISIRDQLRIYDEFVRTYQFSTVPFWNDSRIYIKDHLQPVRTIDDVNLLNSTIVIASCCRNVARYLHKFRTNIDKIVRLFGDYRIYLCESDSEDQTLNILHQWKRNDSSRVQIISKGEQRSSWISRTNRISLCRNSMLERIYAESISFDYYFVIDVDVGSSSSFDIKDFLSNFIYPSDRWLGMAATQRAEYYDIWALRVPPVIDYDCWQLISHLASFYLDRTLLINRLVHIHQKPIPRSTPLIPVQSAFGGAAIYSMKFVSKHCFYDGHFHSNDLGLLGKDQQCEHVAFNQCLLEHSDRLSLFINPRFQIT